jgi:hypothetical protein
MRKSKEPRIRLKRSGREGWMFFKPTIGTYQNKKMSKKRIRQVKTNSPIKILFGGLISKIASQKLKFSAPAYPARAGWGTFRSKFFRLETPFFILTLWLGPIFN